MFEVLRDWWITPASDPLLLLVVRIASTVFALLCAWAWRRLAHVPILEATWEARDVRTFHRVARVLMWWALLMACYTLMGGILEAERTSSPHRLLVANVALASLLLPTTLLGIFLQFVYTRKTAVKVKQARQEAA